MKTEIRIPESDLNRQIQHDWSKIYELACRELGIQQEKRDKVINLYLFLCGFLVPLVVNAGNLTPIIRGLIFLVAAIVGFLFTLIVIRYRVYKEVHWITCSTITKLPYLKPGKVTKENVQGMFLDSLQLRAKSFHSKKGGLSFLKFVWKNLFSAETFSLLVVALLSSIMLGLSIYLLFEPSFWAYFWGIGMLVYHLLSYMRELFKVYQCVNPSLSENKREDHFNDAFKKAWFLHVYYEDAGL